jgi:predicted dehydrogenase
MAAPLTGGPVRFGVIGTGSIATRFAEDLTLVDDATLVAVGSRGQDSAEAFADRFGVPHRHGSYAALIADPEVDVVYVATPHPGHHDTARLAIDAGKAVLLEKPFTMDAGQAQDLVDTARAGGTFLMEAMRPRFMQHMVRVRDLVADGALGELTTVIADYGEWFAHDPGHRLFARELGGGALLDLGVYPVSLASMVLGPPARITARATFTPTGVDAQTSALLEHEGGAHAVLTTTLLAETASSASIVGTRGRIDIDGPLYHPPSFTLVDRAGTVLERRDSPGGGHGLWQEITEVVRCLRAGLTESPTMPLDETVSIMRTMDEIRRQIGLTY